MNANLHVVKRDGSQEEFISTKIYRAVAKAYRATGLSEDAPKIEALST